MQEDEEISGPGRDSGKLASRLRAEAQLASTMFPSGRKSVVDQTESINSALRYVFNLCSVILFIS